jgi:protein-S-isoprenylcysteine O-methyltransferase Ste14
LSLIPAFELGFWNAWIFMVPALLAMLLCLVLMMKKGAPGGPARVPCKSKTTLLVASVSKFIIFPAAILVDWAYTPAGEPVTRGIYRYSRHPMYVTMILLLLGVSIISASWVFLLFTIIAAVGLTRSYFVKIEEAQCLGHYGAAYREYMNRTPRWIGLPKSRKE